MTDEKRQWVEVVANLTALTQRGELKWQLRDDAHAVPYQSGASFFATHKDRNLRLTERRVPIWGWASDPPLVTPEGVAGTRRSLTHTLVVDLDLVDNRGTPIWRFPYVAGLEDLYRAAQRQVAGVESIISDFLED